MPNIIVQKWEESERGWGTRPDGYSLHLTETDRVRYVRAYSDALPAEVPDEYSRPNGTPYVWDAPEDTVAKLKAAGDFGTRFYSNKYPGSQGPDGWRSVG